MNKIRTFLLKFILDKSGSLSYVIYDCTIGMGYHVEPNKAEEVVFKHAQDKNGESYTVRMMAQISSAAGGRTQTAVSVTIWHGKNTNGIALFQAAGQDFYGSIK